MAWTLTPIKMLPLAWTLTRHLTDNGLNTDTRHKAAIGLDINTRHLTDNGRDTDLPLAWIMWLKPDNGLDTDTISMETNNRHPAWAW